MPVTKQRRIAPTQPLETESLPTPTLRPFGRWWRTDLKRQWPFLLGATTVICAINLVLLASALALHPELRDLLIGAQSFTAVFRTILSIIQHWLLSLGIVLIFMIVNIILASWFFNRIGICVLQPARPPNRSWLARTWSLLGTTLLGLLVLGAIAIIGAGISYGVSRWFIGVILPMTVLTFAVMAWFAIWFIFVPFATIWDGWCGTRALSVSQRYVRRSRTTLLIVLVYFCLTGAIVFLLHRLALWSGIVGLLLCLPPGLSLLTTLYADQRQRG